MGALVHFDNITPFSFRIVARNITLLTHLFSLRRLHINCDTRTESVRGTVRKRKPLL